MILMYNHNENKKYFANLDDCMVKLLRVTTVPTSLSTFCTGLLRELVDEG